MLQDEKRHRQSFHGSLHGRPHQNINTTDLHKYARYNEVAAFFASRDNVYANESEIHTRDDNCSTALCVACCFSPHMIWPLIDLEMEVRASYYFNHPFIFILSPFTLPLKFIRHMAFSAVSPYQFIFVQVQSFVSLAHFMLGHASTFPVWYVIVISIAAVTGCTMQILIAVYPVDAILDKHYKTFVCIACGHCCVVLVYFYIVQSSMLKKI